MSSGVPSPVFDLATGGEGILDKLGEQLKGEVCLPHFLFGFLGKSLRRVFFANKRQAQEYL